MLNTKPLTIRILLLEDDLQTVATLTQHLSELESALQDDNIDLSLVVLSEYTMVEQYINSDKQHPYDIILLDRDCKAGGSFHTIFTNADPTKIISISSMPQWNEQAERKGVTRIVWKDYSNLRLFAENVMEHVKDLILINHL